MAELTAKILEEGIECHSILNIPGIAYRHGEKIVINAPKFIEKLDEIPYPAREASSYTSL
jgi:radical SAM superfamily enzyme YgiQ (UPF0313 family)